MSWIILNAKIALVRSKLHALEGAIAFSVIVSRNSKMKFWKYGACLEHTVLHDGHYQ
jgi:hypothetical protein